VRPTRNKPQKRHATHHAPGKPAAHPPRPKQPQQLPTNLERIFGKHSVRAVFLTRPRTVKRLIIAGDESYHTEFIEMAERAGIKPEFLAWPEFERLGHFTKDEKHQGIFILADPRKIYAEKDFDSLADARVVLALDQISNPQNFATILRSAAFFGRKSFATPWAGQNSSGYSG